MISIYINVYDKKIIDLILKNISKFRVYSQGSSYRYLIENQIDAIEIKKTDIHPNFIVISSLFKNQKKQINLVIADTNENDYLNKILILAATLSNIPVASDMEMIQKLNQSLEIFGDITDELKKEMIHKNLSKFSYFLSQKSYDIFPYIIGNETTIPLKKLKDFQYGENPHQKAYYYHSPLKTSLNLNNIEVLNGELNFNHIIDITKIIRILRDIKQNTILIMRHSNIVFAAVNESFQKLFSYIDNKILKSSIVAINGSVDDIDVIRYLEGNLSEMIIATSFDEKIKDNFNKHSFQIKAVKVKITSIDAPKEYEIINAGENFLIQDADTFVEEKLLSITRNINIHPDPYIQFALALLKHSKTFSSLCITGNILVALSQSEPSPIEAIRTLIAKIKIKMSDKNMIKLKGNTIVAFEGKLDDKIIDELAQVHLNTLIITDRDAVKNYSEKLKKLPYEVVVSEKRHFRHF